MVMNSKEQIAKYMEDRTTITIPIVLRNKLFLLKKKGEAMYNVIERLLELNEKVEKIKEKRKQNLTKNSEVKKNARNKIEQEPDKTTTVR